jgi:hypothetical protein
MADYRIGKGGKFVFDTEDVHVKTWRLKLINNLQDGTTTGSAGKKEWYEGESEYEFSAEIFVDFTTMLTDVIFEGAQATAEFYIGDSTKFFTGLAIIGDVEYVNDKGSLVTYNVNGKINGALTSPVLAP